MSNSIPIRVAILVCDTPIKPVLTKYGDYYALFQDLLGQAFSDLNTSEGTSLEFSNHHMVENEDFPDLENIDALVMTGSKHNAWADDSWIRGLTSYVRDAITIHNKPVVGICFGHQILARALGATVGQNSAGWEISVEKMDLTDAGKSLFGKDTLSIQQMHRDIILDAPPAGCVNLATTSNCGIQGLYMPNKVLSVQGHPEFHEGIMSFVLAARHESGIFDDRMYNDGLSRAADPHDGKLIARTMVKFILDAKIASTAESV